MLAKVRRSLAYRASKLLLLGTLTLANYAAYRTLWRDHRAESVEITDNSITEAIKKADGDDLQDKLEDVINEVILFQEEEPNDKFKAALSGFLDKKGLWARDMELSLEDKIYLAQNFSSTLSYNTKANIVDNASSAENIDEFMIKSLQSIYEFTKLNVMRPDELVEYNDVVCLQYAKVFAAALHEINKSSSNPEDITIATMVFVPNYEEDYGVFFDSALKVVNSLIFSEWRSAVPHAISLVATGEKTYFVEPQSSVFRSHATIEVNKEYKTLIPSSP